MKPAKVTLAYYNGIVFDMDYVPDPKQRYQFAYYRITDNGFSGYVLDGSRLSKRVESGARCAPRGGRGSRTEGESMKPAKVRK